MLPHHLAVRALQSLPHINAPASRSRINHPVQSHPIAVGDVSYMPSFYESQHLFSFFFIFFAFFIALAFLTLFYSIISICYSLLKIMCIFLIHAKILTSYTLYYIYAAGIKIQIPIQSRIANHQIYLINAHVCSQPAFFAA